MNDPLGDAIERRFYPGSSQEIRDPTEPPPTRPDNDEDPWDAYPVVFPWRGSDTEFFTLGALAKAMGKSPITLRTWERRGWLPLARYRTSSVNPQKAKRLYTRAQVEGIVKIAREEGLLQWKPQKVTRSFTVRVVELFKALEA